MISVARTYLSVALPAPFAELDFVLLTELQAHLLSACVNKIRYQCDSVVELRILAADQVFCFDYRRIRALTHQLCKNRYDAPNFAQCEHIGLIPSQRIFFLRHGRHLHKHGALIFRPREGGKGGDIRLRRTFTLRFLGTIVYRRSPLHCELPLTW